MSIHPPRRDSDPADEAGLVERLEPGGLDPEAFRTVDGAYSDEPLDPAMIPVIEAGGGVAEGFEQAEALLVDHACEGDLDGTERILRDAGPPEAPDPGVYGEADEEHSSARVDEGESS